MHIPSEKVDLVESDASLSDSIPRWCEADWWRVLPGDLSFHPDSLVELHPHFKCELLRYINQFRASIHTDHFQATLAHSCLTLAGNVSTQEVHVVGWESNLPRFTSIWDYVPRSQKDNTDCENRYTDSAHVHQWTDRGQMFCDIGFLFTFAFFTKRVSISLIFTKFIVVLFTFALKCYVI